MKIRELVNENKSVNPDIAIEIFRELLRIVMPIIDKEYKNRDIVNIEDMDNAIDKLCDFLDSKYIVLDIWDTIWDMKIDRRNIDVETLKKIEKLISLIEKKIKNMIGNS